jgi:hypothetical protein
MPKQGRYKLFGLVTNRDLPGEEIIQWPRQRCGKSEEAHSVMKEDLAGGELPSGDFGENAAWWGITDNRVVDVNLRLKYNGAVDSGNPSQVGAINN